MTPSRTLIVACPHCGGESRYDGSNPFRPFCCERCRMMDLGKWADEEFRVTLTDEESLPGIPQQ